MTCKYILCNSNPKYLFYVDFYKIIDLLSLYKVGLLEGVVEEQVLDYAKLKTVEILQIEKDTVRGLFIYVS